MTRSRARPDIYRGKDPRDLALYAPSEAALFLHLPESTVRAWAFGQRKFKPVLEVAGVRGRARLRRHHQGQADPTASQ